MLVFWDIDETRLLDARLGIILLCILLIREIKNLATTERVYLAKLYPAPTKRILHCLDAEILQLSPAASVFEHVLG